MLKTHEISLELTISAYYDGEFDQEELLESLEPHSRSKKCKS